MHDLKHDLNVLWKYRDAIADKVSIVTLMSRYGLSLEPKETGNEFSHRARCPFHKGKGPGGTERTPSMFVSNSTNSFFCFGCGASGSVIDFVMLIDGSPPVVALKKLAKDVGVITEDGKWDELQLDALKKYVPEAIHVKTIEPHLFDISRAMRNYIQRFINHEDFDKELRWIGKVGQKVDGFLSNIGHEDWEYSQDLFNKVEKSINNRLKKYGEK